MQSNIRYSGLDKNQFKHWACNVCKFARISIQQQANILIEMRGDVLQKIEFILTMIKLIIDSWTRCRKQMVENELSMLNLSLCI